MRAIYIVGPMLLVLAAPALPRAQTLNAGFSDAGTFKIRSAGKDIGKETFKIGWQNGVLKAEADITLTKSPGELTLHTELSMDGSGKVIAYTATKTGVGGKKELKVTFEERVAICEEKGPSSTDSTPVIFEPGFLMLDTNVFHHFEILGQRLLSSTPPNTIPVLIPQEGVSGTLKVTAAGKESLKVGKRRVAVVSYKLDSGQVQIQVWFDESGKLQKITVPQTKAEVTRVE